MSRLIKVGVLFLSLFLFVLCSFFLFFWSLILFLVLVFGLWSLVLFLVLLFLVRDWVRIWEIRKDDSSGEFVKPTGGTIA